MAKSPTEVPLTQGHHVFMSIYLAFKLEHLSLKHQMNHFALKAKLYITAIRQAFDELMILKSYITQHPLIIFKNFTNLQKIICNS